MDRHIVIPSISYRELHNRLILLRHEQAKDEEKRLSQYEELSNIGDSILKAEVDDSEFLRLQAEFMLTMKLLKVDQLIIDTKRRLNEQGDRE